MGGDLALGRIAKQHSFAGPETLLRFMRTLVTRAIERGEVTTLPAGSTEIFVGAVIQGFIFSWFHAPDSARLTEQTETAVQLILHGIACPQSNNGAAAEPTTDRANRKHR